MTGQRIAADGANGVVMMSMDIYMANAVADALEYTFASGGLDVDERPEYLFDVLSIRTAVATARTEQIEYVPVERPMHLRVVGGDSA